jgi:hypothetical protein
MRKGAETNRTALLAGVRDAKIFDAGEMALQSGDKAVAEHYLRESAELNTVGWKQARITLGQPHAGCGTVGSRRPLAWKRSGFYWLGQCRCRDQHPVSGTAICGSATCPAGKRLQGQVDTLESSTTAV